MALKIFTTTRQIRRWLEGIDNSFLDKKIISSQTLLLCYNFKIIIYKF